MLSFITQQLYGVTYKTWWDVILVVEITIVTSSRPIVFKTLLMMTCQFDLHWSYQVWHTSLYELLIPVDHIKINNIIISSDGFFLDMNPDVSILGLIINNA